MDGKLRSSWTMKSCWRLARSRCSSEAAMSAWKNLSARESLARTFFCSKDAVVDMEGPPRDTSSSFCHLRTTGLLHPRGDWHGSLNDWLQGRDATDQASDSLWGLKTRPRSTKRRSMMALYSPVLSASWMLLSGEYLSRTSSRQLAYTLCLCRPGMSSTREGGGVGTRGSRREDEATVSIQGPVGLGCDGPVWVGTCCRSW